MLQPLAAHQKVTHTHHLIEIEVGVDREEIRQGIVREYRQARRKLGGKEIDDWFVFLFRHMSGTLHEIRLGLKRDTDTGKEDGDANYRYAHELRQKALQKREEDEKKRDARERLDEIPVVVVGYRHGLSGDELLIRYDKSGKERRYKEERPLLGKSLDERGNKKQDPYQHLAYHGNTVVGDSEAACEISINGRLHHL